MNRRDFIRLNALALAGATQGWRSVPVSAMEGKFAPAIACRDGHLRETGQSDAWSAMKAIGVTGVEVNVNQALRCVSLFHPQKQYAVDTEDHRKELLDDLAANGLHICAFMMGNRFEERPDEEKEWVSRTVAAAEAMGVKTIRIDVAPQRLQADEFEPFAIEMCKQICALVKDRPVRFGIENHGNMTNRPEFLEALFNGVGSESLGLTMDTANFYWFGHPLDRLYSIYEKFVPRVFHTHCKNIRYPDDKKNVERPIGWEYEKYNCPLYEGDIDFQRVVSILQKANYGGDLCIEDESLGKALKGDREGILKNEASYLKKMI